MFIIQRTSHNTDITEILLKDGTWTDQNRGQFVCFRHWDDAVRHLLSLVRDHSLYRYNTHEISLCVPIDQLQKSY